MPLVVRFSKINQSPAGVLPQSLYLQVPSLEDWTVESSADWQDYTTKTGEYSNAGGGPLLQSTTFQTLTIGDPDAGYVLAGSSDPDYIDAQLIALRDNRAPFLIMVYFGQVPLSASDDAALQNNLRASELRMRATIRSLTRISRFGEPETVYWTIAVKEWRDAVVDRQLLRARSRSGGSALPFRYALASGDTLRSISKDFYGNDSFWRTIAEANGIRNWGASTSLTSRPGLNAGTRLSIPVLLTGEA